MKNFIIGFVFGSIIFGVGIALAATQNLAL